MRLMVQYQCVEVVDEGTCCCVVVVVAHIWGSKYDDLKGDDEGENEPRYKIAVHLQVHSRTSITPFELRHGATHWLAGCDCQWL